MCDPILVTLLKMQPHYSQSSRENATPSSGTSPVASYKEVPHPPGENSKDLFAAAYNVLIPGLKTVSRRFLERQMSESNCISTFYFAEMYQCNELITNTRKFIHANFASVAEMDEFLTFGS